MYIEPTTTIRILKNVPLDSTYEHTIYFANKTAQEEYFRSLSKFTLDRQSYQRVQRGYMRVSINAERLYDCNYVMFQNFAFGDKWFYAFIKSVEYINNSVAQIEFEIDVMQTWLFDYTLKECFVEREHSATDNLFENLVEEDLDLGDDYISNGMEVFDLNDMSVCVLASRAEIAAVKPVPKIVNNIYTPLYARSVSLKDKEIIDNIINAYVDSGRENDIIAIFQYPSVLGKVEDGDTATNININITPNLNTINGYTPRNKKLFSYPYNYIGMTNNAGANAIFKYEDWNIDSRGRFRANGAVLTSPCVLVYPINYRGIEFDYDSGLTLSNFPQNAWVGDTFKAWLAQNKATFTMSIVSSTLSAALNSFNQARGIARSFARGNDYNVTSSGAGGIGSAVAKIQDLKNTPPQIHGQTQTDSLNAGMHRVQYNFYKMSIKAQFARIIDDYFDRFGYSIHRTKIPNRNVRPHWTYCKTIDCTIVGSVPSDDLASICSIYDKGITWWLNGSEVGNYSLDNTPIGSE